MYLCVKVIDFASFYDYTIGCSNLNEYIYIYLKCNGRFIVAMGVRPSFLSKQNSPLIISMLYMIFEIYKSQTVCCCY